MNGFEPTTARLRIRTLKRTPDKRRSVVQLYQGPYSETECPTWSYSSVGLGFSGGLGFAVGSSCRSGRASKRRPRAVRGWGRVRIKK